MKIEGSWSKSEENLGKLHKEKQVDNRGKWTDVENEGKPHT